MTDYMQKAREALAGTALNAETMLSATLESLDTERTRADEAEKRERELREAFESLPTAWLYTNRHGDRCVQFAQGLMDLEHWREEPLYLKPT